MSGTAVKSLVGRDDLLVTTRTELESGGSVILTPFDARKLVVGLRQRLRALPEPVRQTLLVTAAATRPTVHSLRAAGCDQVEDDLAIAAEAGVARVTAAEVVTFEPRHWTTSHERYRPHRRVGGGMDDQHQNRRASRALS